VILRNSKVPGIQVDKPKFLDEYSCCQVKTNPPLQFKLLIPLCMGFCRIALATSQPNIVLFFVDDLGWSDLG
jgi:hypothetical protein